MRWMITLLIICLIPYSFYSGEAKLFTPLGIEDIKVGVLYERVTDGINFINRSIEDVIDIFRETNADFIFRGWWRWSPCPDNANMSLPEEYPLDYVEKCDYRGYTYEYLEEAVKRIKEEIPGIIFCGAIPAQRITRLVWNPVTKEFFGTNETWNMALDPMKWGTNMTKIEFQYYFAKWHYWVDPNSTLDEYDYRNVSSYFPDITNDDFQELLLSWAYKQIDCGADAIWIDMLFTQASILYKITGSFSHPAVRESYDAACKIIDEIHEYGEKVGRYIYVGTWSTCAVYPYEKPSLDFLTASPSSIEVYKMELNETRWDERISIIEEKFAGIPFFVFIDWAATTHTPLGVFSQYLSKEQQREFIKKADIFFAKKCINFIYPVHGGTMGVDSEIHSYGKWNVYDSLAPEFETYDTIVKLAKNKSEGKPFVDIMKPSKGIYILDREVFPFTLPIILGKITIEVEPFDSDGIDHVEFYVDGILKFNDTNEPYQWTWNESAFGLHVIKVIAYDNMGNNAEDKLNVIIFNLGGEK